MIDPFEPGAVLADKYRVVRELGRGGMGVVLAADHLQLQQTVAVKLMKAGASEVALARFQREARLVARLRSPHVCRVLDVGALDSGEPFIVMEMLEGGDLGQVLEQRGPLAVNEVAEYVIQALDAIGEAHLLSVVHRDLKPGNLFLSQGVDGSPLVKVLDFGISKASAQDDGLTATGELIGSPRFMAPEQMRKSVDVDTRADIWALGAVMYELLVGAPAFEADTVAELIVLILQEDPEPLAGKRPDLPAPFVAVVERCLRKEAEARFANVAELALALEPFAPSRVGPPIQRLVGAFEATGWRPPPSMSATQAGGSPPGIMATPAAPVSVPPAQGGATHQGWPAPSPAAPPATSGTPPPSWGPSYPAAPAAPSPAAKSNPAAIAALAAVLLLFVVGGLGVGIWLWRGDEDSGPSASDRSSSERADESGSVSPRGLPVSGEALYDGAAAFVQDAVKRNRGHDRLVFVNLYRSGMVQVGLQAHDKASRVMRWQYQSGELEREQNYTKHFSDPMPASVFRGVDFDVVGAIHDDAMKRSAREAGSERLVFMIGIKKEKGDPRPRFMAMVEGDDANATYLYDAKGRFVRKQ